MNCGESFYGSVTVGERGQVVIPADARAQLGINAGDKLIVMKHPVHKGLMVFKFDSMRAFLDELSEGLDRMQNNEIEKETAA